MQTTRFTPAGHRLSQHQTNQPLSTTGPSLSSTRRQARRPRRKPTRRRRRGDPVAGARNSLKRFSQATILALAITSFILLLLGGGEEAGAQDPGPDTTRTERLAEVPDTVSVIEEMPTEQLVEEIMREGEAVAEEEEVSAREATDQALGTIRGIWTGFYRNLPKIGLALVVLVIAWGAARLLKVVLTNILGRWERSNGIITLVSIAVWLLFVGVAVSIVVGDIRALIGSLGLVGLALSWSLQTPIESFTGWLLNSFQGYYRVGDRISVGDVFGDVYRIDFLTTTVWEIGAPYRPGFVQAEQPTGRLVTFPNNEVLTGTVVNLTRDFPYVWDELAVAVANESDLRLALQVLTRISQELLGNYMAEPSRIYSALLQEAGLENYIQPEPQVYISANDSWTDCNIRYLVGARERRKWKSELTLLVTEEFSKPEYMGKIISAYSRTQIQFIQPDGSPASLSEFGKK